jgi:hypothetical protein
MRQGIKESPELDTAAEPAMQLGQTEPASNVHH